MVDLGFDPQNILVLVGPTGSGKTALVPSLAKSFSIEAVCLDAMQCYREFRLGSAAPTDEDRAVCPHHLFGSFSITQPLSASQFQKEAFETVKNIQDRGNLPLLIGGTGMYLSFFCEDRSGLPPTDPAIRQRVEGLHEKKGSQRLHRILGRIDPNGAKRLHPNDSQRIKRFLEVRLLTGKSITEFWEAQNQPSLSPVIVGLAVEKELLWKRLQERTDLMIESGWLDEARDLLKQDLEPFVQKVRPIGYNQLFRFLKGEISLEYAKERIFFETRQYAKRQMTWFRKLKTIEWFHYDRSSGYNDRELLAFVHNRLG